MSKTTRWMVAALIAVTLPSYASIASAAPVIGALAIKNAAPNSIETVRWGWRGGGWGRGWGWGVGGGLVAGALIGSALAAPYYGGYYGGPYYYARPYYYPGPAYYAGGYYDVDPGYYAEPYASGGSYYRRAYAGGGGDVNYCMRRYRTYDLRSGTFMGNDGRRHPCP